MLPDGASMEGTVDLQTIAARTGLPPRRLRYVLDHRLLPGMRVRRDAQAQGQPRYFTDFEGFGVALAAQLLEGGLRREAVVTALDWLFDLTWPVNGRPTNVMLDVFSRQKPATAALADLRYV